MAPTNLSRITFQRSFSF